MRIKPEFSSCRIVLYGRFDPSVFAPHWFEGCGIFTSEEADDADIETVQHGFTAFKMNWLKLGADRKRFTVEAREPPYNRLSDFVFRTFNAFLPLTPIGAFSISRMVHFDVGSHETRDRIIEILAPKRAWGDWAGDLGAAQGDEQGGLLSLEMIQRKLSDRPHGYVRAKVQSSRQIRNERTGIYMEIDDHFEVQNADNVERCDEAMTLLQDSMEDSVKRAEWIIDQIMALK